MTWEDRIESQLSAGERKSLSLPAQGEFDPVVWDENKAKEGLPCESDDGCTNNATKTFTIMGGREGNEWYEDVSLCPDHEDQPLYYYHERKIRESR